MKFISDETRQARAELVAANQRLDQIAERDKYESEAFADADAAVDVAQARLPWYKRLDIDAGCYPDRDDDTDIA